VFRDKPELKSSLARIARLLINAGADPAASWMYDGRWPLRPLYFACGASNNDEVARVLLDAGADPCDGESVYHASDEGHAECLSLFEKYVDPERLAKECTFALRVQMHWGRTRGAAWLLAHGADPNAPAADNVHDEDKLNDSALHAAARNGAGEDVIALLLAHGANPRAKNRAGKTAIEVARKAAKMRVVRQLQAAVVPTRPSGTPARRRAKERLR
jgi:ankyrin repeat protein